MKWKLTDSNKRSIVEECKKERVWDALHGASYMLKTRNRELERARHSIQELEKMVGWSTAMQREDRLDFEAQIINLKKALKAWKDGLSIERLQKEEVEQALMHEKFQMGIAQEHIKNLESLNLGAAYQVLRNNCIYSEGHYKISITVVVERYVIIINLQVLFFEWKEKFENMVGFTNYVIWELPEADKVMCLENMHC